VNMDQIADKWPWLAAVGALVAPYVWVRVKAWLAKRAAEETGRLIDSALEMGDAEWDKIVMAVVEKLEKEIPDGLDASDPKVQELAVRIWPTKPQYAAELLVVVAKAIDGRARKLGRRP